MEDALRDDPLYRIGDRVALAPHRDEWMRGDRYGEVKAISWNRIDREHKYTVALDSGRHARLRDGDIRDRV